MKNRTKFEDFDGGYSSALHCNVGAAMVGSAAIGLIGGGMQSSASKKAGESQANAARDASATQLQATRETNNMQWDMLRQNMASSSPYMQGGQQAFSALMGGMNLGGLQATQTGAGAYSNEPHVIGGQPTGYGTGQGINNYGATQQQLDQARGSVPQGFFTKQFGAEDLKTDPSYEFRLNEGLRALQSSAAARGGLLTGQGAKDINNYAQDSASTEYQNAYNRFTNRQSDIYNRLSSLAGVGQTMTSGANAAGQQTASNVAQNTMNGVNASTSQLTSAAAAQAAGRVGSANAWGNAMNGTANNWMTLQYLNKMPSGTGATSYPVRAGDVQMSPLPKG
jgi:hypothetical protein